ncbi:MAG: hypothetical protein V1792_17520 [Pseudomonadota bacterium]
MAVKSSGKTLSSCVRLKLSTHWLVVCVICLFASGGCVWNRTPAPEPADEPSESSVRKTTEIGIDAAGVEKEKAAKSSDTGTAKPPTSGNPPAVGGRGEQDSSDLDRRLRQAARELALELGEIKAMRLCYMEKANEWWVILYRDIGPVIDVRNFIWNWEEQMFRPYLVVKRIPKNELHARVRKPEWGKKCEILPVPEAPKPKEKRSRDETGPAPQEHEDTKETDTR